MLAVAEVSGQLTSRLEAGRAPQWYIRNMLKALESTGRLTNLEANQPAQWCCGRMFKQWTHCVDTVEWEEEINTLHSCFGSVVRHRVVGPGRAPPAPRRAT